MRSCAPTDKMKTSPTDKHRKPPRWFYLNRPGARGLHPRVRSLAPTDETETSPTDSIEKTPRRFYPNCPGAQGLHPWVRSRALASKTKIPRTILPESPGGSGAIVGFINPGSLGDRLPCPGSAQEGSKQLMGRPKSLKQQGGRVIQSPTGRSGRRGTTPARQLLRPISPTGALASDSSRLRTASPIGRPGPKRYFRLRLRVSDRGAQKLCSPLFFDWRDQSRLGPSDQERPLGRRQGRTEKASQGT